MPSMLYLGCGSVAMYLEQRLKIFVGLGGSTLFAPLYLLHLIRCIVASVVLGLRPVFVTEVSCLIMPKSSMFGGPASRFSRVFFCRLTTWEE